MSSFLCSTYRFMHVCFSRKAPTVSGTTYCQVFYTEGKNEVSSEVVSVFIIACFVNEQRGMKVLHKKRLDKVLPR